MMELYKWYSALITSEVSAHGAKATKYSHVRSMRIVKREILRLVQEFIQRSEDPDVCAVLFHPTVHIFCTGAAPLNYQVHSSSVYQ